MNVMNTTLMDGGNLPNELPFAVTRGFTHRGLTSRLNYRPFHLSRLLSRAASADDEFAFAQQGPV